MPAPTLPQIAPLLQSCLLAKSLVILATHQPPDIPGLAIPAVRILHLSAPLALEDAGAVRFVTVLEWAERIARIWRKHGGGGVLEYSEAVDINSELAPPSALRFGTQSTPASPGSSSTHLNVDPPSPSFRPSSIVASVSFKRGQASLPPPDPSQRPFDVLVNFMPDNVPDKSLLKNSILVTTISRPFLTSTVPPATVRSRTNSSSSTRPRPRPRSIFGTFSRSTTSVYLPPTPPYSSGDSLSLSQVVPPPPGKALAVHLLPPAHPNVHPSARRRLVESMENFLVSFAFQESPVAQPPSMGTPSGSAPLERARPYVMQATTFCDSVSAEPGVDCGDWTVADVVLSGALDADSPSTSPAAFAPATSAKPGPALSRRSRRAWISAAADLVIMPSGDDISAPAPASVSALAPPMDSTAGMSRARTESALSAPSPSRTFGRQSRSTSAPLLEAGAWRPPGAARPMSHPQQLAQAPAVVSRAGKGSYAVGNGADGLPTPPQSEEDGSAGCANGEAGSKKDRCTTSAVAPATSDSMALGEKSDGKNTLSKRARWKFWRRLTATPGGAPIVA